MKQGTILITTALAKHIGQLGNALVQFKPLWRLGVLLKELAVEAIYPARCSESFVVHVYPLSVEY